HKNRAGQDQHGTSPRVELRVVHRLLDGSPQHHAPVTHAGLLRRPFRFGNHAAAKEKARETPGPCPATISPEPLRFKAPLQPRALHALTMIPPSSAIAREASARHR